MSTNVLIGGVGNVLLGDDAVGPYVIRILESEYTFPDNVEVVDLGTPALDLTHRISGLHAVILVDCVASDEYSSGSVLLYKKEEILRLTPTQRLDPHSPALSECLMTAEMLGTSPEHVTLVGVVGQNFEPGHPLSSALEIAAEYVLDTILSEVRRLGVPYARRQSGPAPAIWWTNQSPHACQG